MLRRTVKALLVLQPFLVYFHSQPLSAQTVSDVLAECRATYEKISSYEFSAIRRSREQWSPQVHFFVARDGEAYRYDQSSWLLRNDGEVSKYGFDGLYYYEEAFPNTVEKICSPPTKVSLASEPFQRCFYWLTTTGSRSELLKKSRWDEFAKSCDALVSKEQVEGFACTVVTSGVAIEGWRFEVAFAVEVGSLPVRVRRVVGKEKAIVGEESFTDFMRFTVDGETIHFPTTFTTKASKSGEEFWGVTKIKPGTLIVNTPIPQGLFRLEQDSAKFNLMNDSGTEQDWFQPEGMKP